MNFKENESSTKLRGGYYTDPQIASFLLRWVLKIHPKSILEPSCGDGVFFRSLKDLNTSSIEYILGFEIDSGEAEKARNSAKVLRDIKTEVMLQNFLSWSLLQLINPLQFDAVVGNPPFIRYQYLENDLQAIFKKIYDYFRLPFTMHTNAWVPFVILSLALLSKGGRLAMVLPSELLHILHAESLRKYLTQVCSKILIIDPQELWFEKTLQGAILLLAEKKLSNSSQFLGIGIVPTRTKTFLYEDPEYYFNHTNYNNGETVEGKWMTALLTESERNLLKKTQNQVGVYRFDEIADVAVGIVTGANRFFLVPDDVVEKYCLQNWAHPMFGRSEHVPGVIFDKATLERNKKAGLPANFLWFKNEKIQDLPKSVRSYLEEGEKEGLHKRYKCRIREPWYSVPSVYSTCVGMLKRSHDFPRLILNKIEAFTTDTAYRIQPKKVTAVSLVYSFINSLTALTAELEGRHYGGGVLELVPSEIRKLLIPVMAVDESNVAELDKIIQSGISAEFLLGMQDSKILSKFGLTQNESEELLNAWIRLRSRRQRIETKVVSFS